MFVKDIIDDAIEILGRGDKTSAYKRLTETINLLMKKGRWNGCLRVIDINAGLDGKTITLPRDVDTILGVNFECAPLIGRDEWYQFHMNGNGSFDTGAWAWDDSGAVATHQDLYMPSYLVAIAEVKTDTGTNLVVYGEDANGKVLRTQDEDGEWSDGLPVDIHLSTDFPDGIPVEETTRRFLRKFTTVKPSQLQHASSHTFVTGQQVDLDSVSGSVPSPLEVGVTYFVGKDSSSLISLYETREAALLGKSKIEISETPASTLTLVDSRTAIVQTKFQSGAATKISSGDRVEVTATTLPDPFEANKTYYASVIDANSVALHNTEIDALANVDPIDATTVGSGVVLQFKKPIDPVAFLYFNVNHNYLTGDAVTFVNSSGTLPAPLLSSTTYYVRSITEKKITIHNNQEEALNNVNPIVFTSRGAGSTSVVKAISSGVSVGTSQQISAPQHNLSAGDYVQFLTTGTFPSTEIPPTSGTFATLTQGTVYKVANPYSADTLTIKTTSDEEIDILNTGNGQLELLIQRLCYVGFTGEFICDATNLSTGDTVKLDTDGTFPISNPQVTSGTDYYIKKNSDSNIELFEDVADTTKVAVAISSRYRDGGEIFINTATDHGFLTGDKVDVIGIGGTLDGVAATVSLSSTGSGYVQGEIGKFKNSAGNELLLKLDTVAAGDPTAVSVSNGNEGFTIGETLTYVSGLSAGTGKTFTIASVLNTVNNEANNYEVSSVSITKTSNTQFKYSGAGLEVITPVVEAAGSVEPAPIRVAAVGEGGLDLVLEKSVNVVPYSSELKVADTGYIEDGATVRFTSTITLPAPIATSTDYKVYVSSSGYVTLKTTGGSDIVLSGIGSGVHTMTMSRDFTLVPMTEFYVPNHVYSDGDLVTAEFADGTAPDPLVDQTDYYVRVTGEDTIELYDTEAHAINTVSTTGRILPTTSGSGTIKLFQIVDNVKVARVFSVRKDRSSGYIDLLAFDDGRTTDLTKIGIYHPDDIAPVYRRIKVPRCTGVARIKYLVKTFEITSDNDYIPLESGMAILCMLRACELFRTGNFEEAKKYEKQALEFLKEEKMSANGAEAQFIQFNSELFNRSQLWMQ